MQWTETETEIMRDVFRFMRDNAPKVENTEVFWDELTRQAGKILEKYGSHDMAVDFLATACLHFEKVALKDSGRMKA